MRKNEWKPKGQSTQEEEKVSPGFKLVSNRKNDGDKNVENLNIKPIKNRPFAQFAREFFMFVYLQIFSSYQLPGLQLNGRRENLITCLKIFVPPITKRLKPI